MRQDKNFRLGRRKSILEEVDDATAGFLPKKTEALVLTDNAQTEQCSTRSKKLR
jgi:hypothetical protein